MSLAHDDLDGGSMRGKTAVFAQHNALGKFGAESISRCALETPSHVVVPRTADLVARSTGSSRAQTAATEAQIRQS